MSSTFDDLTKEREREKEEEEGKVEEAGEGLGGSDQLPVGPLSKEVKAVLQELLRWGLIEADKRQNYYQIALAKQQLINQYFRPLDLQLNTDEVRGLAFLITARELDSEREEGEEWSHPLVRRNRFTLEQSLLVAILRQYYIIHEQEVGISNETVVNLDEVDSQLKLYLDDLGSDDANDKRLFNLLQHLKEHRIVSNINDKERVTIRPIITHLANPETLKALLSHFKKVAKKNGREKGGEEV